MIFEYFIEKKVNAELEIEELGNCAIKAFNDKGDEYILVIDTILGSCRVFQYGPINKQSDVFPKGISCSFKRIEYSDYKLNKIIDDFLNNGYANITQAFEVDKYEALSDCESIIDYMKQSERF